MNTPVSFELAKLLKEKGYDLSTERFYPKPKCKLFGIDEHGRLYPIVNKTQTYFKGKAAVLKEENYYDAPTITDVVTWLYEKHGIWIVVNITRYGKFWCNVILKEECKDLKNPFNWEFVNQIIDFNSPTEAYEAAIEYALNNLI